jgi:hypothetical protein
MELSANLAGSGLLAKDIFFNGYVNMEQMQGDRNSQISIIEDRAHVQNNKARAILKGMAQANSETVAKQSFNAHHQFIRLILQDKSVFGGFN